MIATMSHKKAFEQQREPDESLKTITVKGLGKRSVQEKEQHYILMS